MFMKEIALENLSLNPWTKIGKDWFLLTSGDENGFNTMTVGWANMGIMWNKNVITAMVRPNRYTYDFMEKNDLFTVSFFGEEHKKALSFCGSHSGRDCDKAKEAGLTPEFIDGTTTFKEAKLTFVCRKIYAQDLDVSLIAEDVRPANGSDPIHKQFMGEIIKVYES
ncbi:MAG: flavin reductase [Oscillospiraceae bacterium]|nr:flavin reductase [Oscillospiraceae bacterium]